MISKHKIKIVLFVMRVKQLNSEKENEYFRVFMGLLSNTLEVRVNSFKCTFLMNLMFSERVYQVSRILDSIFANTAKKKQTRQKSNKCNKINLFKSDTLSTFELLFE